MTGDSPETDHGEPKYSLGTKSAASRKLQNLRNRKRYAKGRLTKARNQLKDLLVAQSDGSLPSKNTIRRAIIKVKSEFDIIEKISGTLREVHTVSEDHEGNTNIDTVILDT